MRCLAILTVWDSSSPWWSPNIAQMFLPVSDYRQRPNIFHFFLTRWRACNPREIFVHSRKIFSVGRAGPPHMGDKFRKTPVPFKKCFVHLGLKIEHENCHLRCPWVWPTCTLRAVITHLWLHARVAWQFPPQLALKYKHSQIVIHRVEKSESRNTSLEMPETSEILTVSTNTMISEIFFFSDFFKLFPRARKKCLHKRQGFDFIFPDGPSLITFFPLRWLRRNYVTFN